MKNKSLIMVVFALGSLIPILARADGDLIDNAAGFTITRMGVGTGESGTAYFDLAEAPASARGCTWQLYYINLSTPAGVATYATLLNARNRGKKLSRLHFFQTSNPGSCTVNLIELKGWGYFRGPERTGYAYWSELVPYLQDTISTALIVAHDWNPCSLSGHVNQGWLMICDCTPAAALWVVGSMLPPVMLAAGKIYSNLQVIN